MARVPANMEGSAASSASTCARDSARLTSSSSGTGTKRSAMSGTTSICGARSLALRRLTSSKT